MKPAPLRRPSLGTALVVQGNPQRFPNPPRPNLRTGKMGYRKEHPMLTSPAGQTALPAAATSGGANQALLDRYVKSLHGN